MTKLTKQQIDDILKDPNLFQPEEGTFRDDCKAISEAVVGLFDRQDLTPKQKGNVVEQSSSPRNQCITAYCNAWRAFEKAYPLGRGAVAAAVRRMCGLPTSHTFYAELPADVKRIISLLREVVVESGLMDAKGGDRDTANREADAIYAKLETLK